MKIYPKIPSGDLEFEYIFKVSLLLSKSYTLPILFHIMDFNSIETYEMLEDSDPTGSDTLQEDAEDDEELLEAAFQKQLKIAESKLQTRVIIRHLPPTITEERFLDIVSPLPAYDSYYFVPADWSLGMDATCRAYITFKTFDDVVAFCTRFDNYTFVDNRGAEFLAMVEFAPFQGMSKNRTIRKDTKVNSIECEAHYQKFLERLDQQRDAAQGGGEFRLDIKLEPKKDEVKLTPLLEYLANQKDKRRDDGGKRDDRRKRQREEERERKRAQQQLLQKQRQKEQQEQQQKQQQQQKQRQQENQKNVDAGRPEKDDKKKQRIQRRAERQARRYEEYRKRVHGNEEAKVEPPGKQTPFSETEYPSVGETMGHRKDKKHNDKLDAKTSKATNANKVENVKVNDVVRAFICSVATFKDVVVREHTTSESDRLENVDDAFNKTKREQSASPKTVQTNAESVGSRRNSNASEYRDDKSIQQNQNVKRMPPENFNNEQAKQSFGFQNKQQQQRSQYNNDRDRNRSNRQRNERKQNRNKNWNTNDNVKILPRQTNQFNKDIPSDNVATENKQVKTDQRERLESEKSPTNSMNYPNKTQDYKNTERTTVSTEIKSENAQRKDEKSRNNEEQRRIRNKDRPSIAIYQPKFMQRSNSSNTNDDDVAKTSESLKPNDNSLTTNNSNNTDTSNNTDNPHNANNPNTNNSNNNKKYDINNKKVARYSEQRFDRRPNRKERRDSCPRDHKT